MYTSRQLKEMDACLIILDVLERILLGMFVANAVYLAFIPLSTFTGASVFSFVLSLIAWRGVKVAVSVADGLISAHGTIILESLWNLNINSLKRNDE